MRLLVPLVALLLAGCATLPTHVERVETHAVSDTGNTRLAHASRSILDGHASESAFLPLPSGVDALLARIVLADAAERTLDAQYYIWRDDLTGRHFANALLRAADRGVRVRVLIDDVGARANDETLLALDAHPNVEIRVFNPIASRAFRGIGMLGDFSRTNRRMHNKAFVADNQAAILGGRNIGDEYFEASGDVAFGDLDVLTFGPGVGVVSGAFDRFWNAPASFPIAGLLQRAADADRLDAVRAELAAFIGQQRESPYVRDATPRAARLLAAGKAGFFRGKANVLFDDPAKVTRDRADTEGRLVPQLAALGIGIQRDLLIVSPYFIPGEAGTAWLIALVKRGVRVRVLTNSLAATDVGAVHAGYSRYRERLLEGGVELFEFKPGTRAKDEKGEKRVGGSSRASLHAKTFVVDRRAVFIGSLNLDPRSIELNTEIGVVCESVPLAQEMAGALEGRLDQIAWRVERTVDASGGARVTWLETDAQGVRRLDHEPEVSAWRRVTVWMWGLLPIESQL